MGLAQSVIVGKVVDQANNAPVPYATVAVVSKSTGKILSGTTSKDNGEFEINSDSSNIRLEITFIGFQKLVLNDLELRKGKTNLGSIGITQDSQSLREVQVQAERSVVEFKLDKRVFNVGQDIASTGAGALEVLNNVPSVNVDIEGNVTLRGNAGVQILINGKPSVLADEGSNALSSITADMIEKIEVITNPSAKYQAEGTSGILNIVLKKEEKKGFNGSVSANAGVPDNHSVGVSLNRRTENFNFFTQFGAGYRSLPRLNENVNYNYRDQEVLTSTGNEFRNEIFYNATLGADYYINKRNIITLAGSYAFEDENQPSETEFTIRDFNDSLLQQWIRAESTEADNPKWRYDLQYKKEFKNNEDHTLLFSALGNFFGKELTSLYEIENIYGNDVQNNQKTDNLFYRADYTFKLDYTNPITEKFSIETGAQYDINDVGNEFEVFNRIGSQWVADTNLTNDFEFDQKVIGVYGTGSYEGEKWGVKAGVRVENTDLHTLLSNTSQENFQNYTNLFPSLHASYKFSKFFSVQAGYSRRIYRPRLWDLNPFFNIRNNFNLRMGNPNLQPEFSNSYELTSILIFKKASINTSVYHLFTTEVIERITFFDGNRNVTMPVNLGTNAKTGVEINGKYNPKKWLGFNGDINFGYFQREGQYATQNFDFFGDQWSGKLMTKFKMKKGFDVELTTRYESDYVTVQGEVSGFAHADMGLRKKFFDGKIITNLGVRDLFASRIRESTASGQDNYQYNFSQRGRFLTFGVSYSFGKGEAMTYTGRRY